MTARVLLASLALALVLGLAVAPPAAADHQQPCQITGEDPVNDTVCFVIIVQRCLVGLGPCPL